MWWQQNVVAKYFASSGLQDADTRSQHQSQYITAQTHTPQHRRLATARKPLQQRLHNVWPELHLADVVLLGQQRVGSVLNGAALLQPADNAQ